MYIKDNYDLYEMHEAEEAMHIARLPICCKCKEHIQSEYAYDVDGLWCQECFDEWVDDVKVEVEEEEEEW